MEITMKRYLIISVIKQNDCVTAGENNHHSFNTLVEAMDSVNEYVSKMTHLVDFVRVSIHDRINNHHIYANSFKS